MLPEEGVNAVRVVVGLLVRGEYEELETLTEARRLTAAEIAAAVARHGRDLISPPDAAFREVDAVAVPHEPADEHAFHVEFPLWSNQESYDVEPDADGDGYPVSRDVDDADPAVHEASTAGDTGIPGGDGP